MAGNNPLLWQLAFLGLPNQPNKLSPAISPHQQLPPPLGQSLAPRTDDITFGNLDAKNFSKDDLLNAVVLLLQGLADERKQLEKERSANAELRGLLGACATAMQQQQQQGSSARPAFSEWGRRCQDLIAQVASERDARLNAESRARISEEQLFEANGNLAAAVLRCNEQNTEWQTKYSALEVFSRGLVAALSELRVLCPKLQQDLDAHGGMLSTAGQAAPGTGARGGIGGSGVSAAATVAASACEGGQGAGAGAKAGRIMCAGPPLDGRSAKQEAMTLVGEDARTAVAEADAAVMQVVAKACAQAAATQHAGTVERLSASTPAEQRELLRQVKGGGRVSSSPVRSMSGPLAVLKRAGTEEVDLSPKRRRSAVMGSGGPSMVAEAPRSSTAQPPLLLSRQLQDAIAGALRQPVSCNNAGRQGL